MIISKINTEIETFCMDSDFRQSYPLIVFWGRGYDLDTQPCLFVPFFWAHPINQGENSLIL